MGLFKKKLSDVWKKEREIQPEEMSKLEKEIEKEGIHVIPVSPNIKEFLEERYRIESKAFKDFIKTPQDEKLYKRASMVAWKEGWFPNRTYDAIKAVGEDKFREIYQRAKANEREILDETRLELCSPQQREQVLKDAKEYSIPINQVAEFYTLLPSVSDEVKKTVFEHAGKFKKHPLDTLKRIMDEMEKRKK